MKFICQLPGTVAWHSRQLHLSELDKFQMFQLNKLLNPSCYSNAPSNFKPSTLDSFKQSDICTFLQCVTN